MESFEFKSGHRLEVTEAGFCLYDTRTDELLVDACNLSSSGWILEVSISSTNREFYIDTHNPLLDDKIDFGISQRK